VAGEAFAGALNEQLTAAAVRPILPAANAALVALMQNSSNAAATISMVNLMALPPKDIATFAKRFSRHRIFQISLYHRSGAV
jgi:hypothetical protein